MSITIEAVRTETDIRDARQLIAEYAEWCAFDLSFQKFDEELAGLPGQYAPPSGELLIARSDGEPAGCVAVHAWDAANRIAEMKRLFVRERFRGHGIGRLLTERIIQFSRAQGYSRIRLDSISDTMPLAIAMYRQMGFRPIPPYRHNPIPSATFWELELEERGA